MFWKSNRKQPGFLLSFISACGRFGRFDLEKTIGSGLAFPAAPRFSLMRFEKNSRNLLRKEELFRCRTIFACYMKRNALRPFAIFFDRYII